MMKKSFVLAALCAAAILSVGCSDDGGAPSVGDSCSVSSYQYSGTECIDGDVYRCVDGVVEREVCSEECRISGAEAMCGESACGQITASGMCDGNVAKICSNGRLETRDCGAAGCGYDSQNKVTCKSSAGGSSDTQISRPGSQTGGCGSVTEKGKCSNNALSYCQNGKLISQTCAFECGEFFNGYYDCLDTRPEQSATSCGNIDSNGICNETAKTVQYCEDGKLYKKTCASGCAVNDNTGIADCKHTCGDVTAQGICEDANTLTFCDTKSGLLVTLSCTSGCITSSQGSSTCKNNAPVSNCGSIDSKGICEGSTLKYCNEFNELVVKTCPDGCQGSDGNSDANCIDNKCGSIDSHGVCEGNVLKYCNNGAIATETCANGCIPSSGSRDAVCNPNVQPSGCGSIDGNGICEGSTLKYCDGGVLHQQVCANGCRVPTGEVMAMCVEPCGSITADGICIESAVKYCDNDMLVHFTCNNGCTKGADGKSRCIN